MLEVILAVALLLCFSAAALLAAAEVSLLRVQRASAMVSAEGGDRRAGDLLALLDDLPVVLNTVLFLVLLAQVGSASIATFLAQRWFGNLGVTIATGVVTIALFLYGEAIPKTLAVRSPWSVARRFTPALRILVRIARPVVAGFVRLADLQSPGQGAVLTSLTEEELRALAHEAAETGAIEPHDATLVDRSFDFGDRSVSEIMVPRNEIVAIDAGEDVAAAFAGAIATGHRRLPVHTGDLDSIAGVVRLRDVAAATQTSPSTRASELMNEVITCTPTDRIARLLRDMQTSGSWMAIVVGEQDRRTVGLVTIEDVVAELVGEITDNRAVPAHIVGRIAGAG